MNQIKQPMTRREFLIVAGCGSAGLVIAGTGWDRLGQATAATPVPAAAVALKEAS